MNRFFKLIIFLYLIIGFLFKTKPVIGLVPYYYNPTLKSLEKDSLSIGQYAYQLLYFGQIEEGFNLAKLAVKINDSDERLWLILSEAQIAKKLYEDALSSLKRAEKINNQISEIYFTKSRIFLKFSRLNEAKIGLEKGLKIKPNNHNAIFQLGNIYLMKKDYLKAINKFDEAVKIKPNFWQAINNKGLAYFEKDNLNLSIKNFEEAISIEENAEPLLGLASCLRIINTNLAIELAKQALLKDPNYVDENYRKEQLWGEKLQNSTKELFKNNQLQIEIKVAKSKINKSS